MANIMFSVSDLGQLNDDLEIYYNFHTDGSITSDLEGHKIPKSWGNSGIKAIEFIKKTYGINSIPENLKRKSFDSPTGHQTIYYTHWGANPTPNAIVTYNGDKNRHKAWIEL